jgi:peptidoglycan hydrolase-like protein with peptidoglycan-binding domain
MARLNETTITVFNNTTSTLTRINQGHNEGGFKSSPLATVGPGVQFTFGSRENFGEREKGDDGFVIYDIGGIGQTFWTIHWSNVDEGISRAAGTLSGNNTNLFDVADEIPEEGGIVNATFTLSDAPRLTEDDFIRDKPVEADEPTLRFGDESVDGWVEYLQRLLVVKGHGPLADNGSFDDATLAAVRAFQQRMNNTPGTPSTGRVFVDGVVGNQTWALLREEDAPPPSTDGREPHSFVEQGREARWLTEDSAFVFLKDDDRLVIQGVSTGDTPIESGLFNARFLIILPNGETVVRDRPIVTPSGSPAAPGELIFAEFEGAASRSLNVENPLLVESFSFQAFMPAELGGDTTQSFNVPLS